MRSLHRWLAVVLSLALPSASLAAEPGATPAPSAPEAADRAAADAADPDYEDALEALRAQRWGEAGRLLDRYLERGGGAHRAEAEAFRELARHLAVSVEAGRPPGLDQRGRAELAVFSTLYGLWAGGLVTYLGHGEGDALLLYSAAFGGAGLGAALVATSGKEITEGRARLVSMGGFWGTVNAAALGVEVGLVDRPLVATMLAAGIGGIVAGASVLDEAPPPGYLALVNTAGLWSGYAAGMILLMAESDLDAEDNFALIVGGADLGLAITALAARDVEISQGRIRLIDLGGLLGTLGAGGVLAAADGNVSAPTVATTLLAGTSAGLLIATLATRSWDDPEGGELRSGLDWRGPGLAVFPGTDGKSVALGANLASGSF